MIDGVRPLAEAPLAIWRADGARHLVLATDLSIYSVSAVLKTAYKFTDRCYVFVTRAAELPEQLLVVLSPKDADGRVDDALMGQFSNELIDQRLREMLEGEFGHLRTLIVAQAFAEGNLLDSDRDEGDYYSDPCGAGARR